MKAKKSQSSVDWANYRKARNECINKVRNAKQTYYLKLANQLKSNNLSQKEWWSLLKKVTNLKKCNKSTYPPIKLNDNSTLVNENFEKANIFNDYFCQQSQVDDDNIDLPVNYDNNDPYCNLDNIIISVQDVKDNLQILNTNKATGPDNVNPMLLKTSFIRTCLSSNKTIQSFSAKFNCS